MGRFVGAVACFVLRPRLILLLSFVFALVFSVLIFVLPNTSNSSPNTITGMALMVMFFEGPMWLIIFAISLRKMGRATKIAAALLTAAASGGAVFPWVIYAAKVNGKIVQYSFCVAIALFAAGLLFPLYLTLVPAARRQVDPDGKRDEIRDGDEGLLSSDHMDRPQTPIQRLSRAFMVAISKFKDGHERHSAELPTVEHRERRSWGSKSEK